MRYSVLPLLAVLACASAVAAEESPVSGEAHVAWLKSTGSSEKETFKGRLESRYVHEDWSHELKLEGLNELDGSTGDRTSERYLVQEKSSWNYTERDYLFVKLQAEKDQQTSWDYQAFAALGYGHIFIRTDTMFLSTELGAGARHNKHELTGATVNDALGNAELEYEWKFRPGARFNEDASVEAGKEGTVIRTRTALTFDLTEVLNLSVVYETKRDDGPADLDDTLTAVGIGYRF